MRNTVHLSLFFRIPCRVVHPSGRGEQTKQRRKTQDEIREVKNVCNKNLPDISVCKTNLQGLQE